ncbi:fatty acid-binding protein DegV [Actinomyces radicidentis]|uniref:Fatty acid-binding protein DegV n=1 Tax=Actinomyces radicidentis TaxID=111015 RepID=A0A0X8JG03_ACTRD|nr:DegV family protein [Actinomyces radicidentis]AMD88177.1 fatty acid-binding protein DegV [Actinomyces radicidentis]
MTLAVVTDSAACLPPALAADRGIDVVTLPVLPGDDGAPATTSRPSVETLAEAYESALSRADQVLALHLTSALSGTVENARLAAAQVLGEDADGADSDGDQRLLVLDSGVSAGALGLAALAASRADDLRRGAGLARESAARSHLFFVVDSLTELRRGGRVERTTAILGGALGIRPILRADARGVGVVETVRGAARARRALIAQAVLAAGGTTLHGPRVPASPVRLAVHYADDPQDGQGLEDELADALAATGAVIDSILRSPIDEALRVHVGPGTLGVAVAPAV